MNYFIKTDCLDLALTLDCGQCFRWTESGGVFSGIVCGRSITARQLPDGIELGNISEGDEQFWEDYFDISLDYGALTAQFSADETLKTACTAAAGIRILRQEPFETLISFIISQNNNIPRIKGIISRLCEGFGERLHDGGYAFPTAERLASLREEDLAPLRAGFRARYILDAARKVHSGEVSLDGVSRAGSDEAREMLRKIVGVGDKVADCTLLFGFHKLDVFPKDVWIKRALAEYSPDGLPECIKGYEGVAQQFLFEYTRKNGANADKERK